LDGVEKDYVDAITDTAEMQELEKEFELKAEYTNQLSILNEKYKDGDTEDFTSVQAFTDEIDKISKEIE
jgi:ssRNA-specific RNase YbeY (16S rRNA maturation enzyme)